MKRVIHALAVLVVFIPYAFGQAEASQSNDPAASLRQYVPNQFQPLGDYVPCMFDDDEDLAMRSLPSARKPNLDEEGAQSFIKLAQSDILSKYGTVDATKTPPERSLTTPAEAKTLYDDLPKNPSSYENMTIYKAINTFASAAKNDKLSDSDIQTLVSTLKSQLGIGAAQRPPNVSCSFSIMPWDEAKTYFGRMVADKYVAIQVNIRNLDKQNEFLLHDIQVAVDTGLDEKSFGRFEAGRDKMIVRGVAQRGESDDRRNRTMNILSTIGSLAGGASGSLIQTVAGASAGANWLSTSVAVFQGPLLSGLNKAWPDRTIANVNDVSDMAFSASSAMKTVVPTQGSVPLVTFIPQQPLGQLPFARCGTKKKGVSATDDVACELFGNKVADSGNFPPSWKFERWAPAALNILKHRTFVVVAGVHIQEVSTNAVSNGISCPVLLDGTIDLSAQDASKDISCTIAGKSLDKAASAKFEQGTSTSIAATLTPASDGNSAKLTFKASDFVGKSGTFELFSVDSSGKETNLSQSLKFAVRTPVIDSVTYSQKGAAATAVTKGEDLTATIRGSNLDRIAEIDLVDTAAKPNVAKGTVVSPSPVLAKTGEITVTFSAGDIAKLKKPAAPPPPAATPKSGKPAAPAAPAATPKTAKTQANKSQKVVAQPATPAAVPDATLQYDTLDDTTKTESAPAGKDPGVGLPSS
jgi:hypothetical protein